MQKDGSYRDLEAIARSHDGKRHGTDVLKDRAELNKKDHKGRRWTKRSRGARSTPKMATKNKEKSERSMKRRHARDRCGR